MRRTISPVVGTVLLILIAASSVGLIYIISKNFREILSRKVGNLIENSIDFYDVYVDLNNKVYLTIYSPNELNLKNGYIPILIRNENGSKKFLSCITANEKIAKEKNCLLCLNCDNSIKGKYVLELDLSPIECDFFTLFNVEKEKIIIESLKYVLKGKVVAYFYPPNMSIVRQEKIFIPYYKFVGAPDFSSTPWMIKYSMYRLWYEVDIDPSATDDIYVYFEVPESVLNDIARYCYLINNSFCETFHYARLFEYNETSHEQTFVPAGKMSEEGTYSAYSVTLARGFIVHFDHLDPGKHYFVLYFPYEYYNDMENYPAGGKLTSVGSGYDRMFICEEKKEIETGDCDADRFVEILYEDNPSISKYGHKIVKMYSYGKGIKEYYRPICHWGRGYITVCFNVSLPFNNSIKTYIELRFNVTEYQGSPRFAMWIVVNKSGSLASRKICFTSNCPGDPPSQYVGTILGTPLVDSVVTGTGFHRVTYTLNELFKDWIDEISEIKRICFKTYAYHNCNGYDKIAVLIDDVKIISEFSTSYLG